jgi:nucleoside-triphosphatase THEP1
MTAAHAELTARYDNVIRQSESLPEIEMAEKMKTLLQDIREAGKTTEEPEQRSFLSNIARDLGTRIFMISGNRPTTKIRPLIEKTEDAIDFVDRPDEVKDITHVYSPNYLLISAPTGYGKTRLIQSVISRLQAQNWFCISVELWRLKRYTAESLAYKILQQLGEGQNELSDLEKYGVEIGRLVIKSLKNNQKSVIIIIDEIENFEQNELKKLLNDFIPKLKRTFDVFSIRLRLILSGQYIFHWKDMKFEIPLKPITLSLFDFSAVSQMIENFSTKLNLDIPSDQKQQIASHLMYITGGHAGSVAKILSKDFKAANPVSLILSKDYFEEYIKPVVEEEIKKHIPDDLRDIFDTLSVVRRFNDRFLKNLIGAELIKWNKTGFELEDRLLATYLIDRKDGFLKNDIIRRLLFVGFRQQNTKDFINVCEKSICFYKKNLEDSKDHRPDIIAIELLFQKMLYIHYKQSGKEEFFESLDEVLKLLVKERDTKSIMESFIELLKNDWEFHFTFNYMFRGGVYNDEILSHELMGKVEDSKETLQGEKNA